MSSIGEQIDKLFDRSVADRERLNEAADEWKRLLGVEG